MTSVVPGAAEVSPAKPWVLLVEDEQTLSDLVGGLLDEAGYEHVSIADHDDLAAAIARWNPRCVMLDSDPGSPGSERSWADAAAIRRAHPALPVLMFTADPASMAEARAGTTARSKAAGYSGVIDKPLLVVEFLATLKHAVGTPHGSAPAATGIATDAVSVFPELAGPGSTGWNAADFFTMAVHELRTSLTAIDGHAQFVERFLRSDPVRAAGSVAQVREQSRRMNGLIGDLLDHARVSAGALRLDVETFDLSAACARTIGMHEHNDPACITLATPGAVRVQGDPERIAQILGNLLDNATKYSPPGSAIDVSLTIVGAEALLRVTDRGVGVPEEELGRIFAPFFRSTRTRDFPGTGLGLHISRRIAELHRGRLWLESSSKAGSIFTLSLPLTIDASG